VGKGVYVDLGVFVGWVVTVGFGVSDGSIKGVSPAIRGSSIGDPACPQDVMSIEITIMIQ
jgi:hypothetical protein